MALLTADDVLNKKFQYVKFREGYDQIEVDEFLDEVVATIYSLTVENTELKEKLEAANRRIAELSSGEVESTVVEAEVVEEDAPEEAPQAAEPEPEVEEAVVEEESTVGAPDTGPEAATSMLALAQRLHDEYVDDGRAEGERIVAEARAEGEKIVSEADDKRDRILSELASQQQELEQTINNLRQFEADYRAAISSHLESLLDQVGKAPGDGQ